MKNRPLWLENLSDEKLKEILLKIQEFQTTGVTSDEELKNIANTQYDNKVGLERFTCLSIDIWKETSFRWLDLQENLTYGVAYEEKSGKGFSETEPFVDFCEDKQECIELANNMENEGYIQVTPFATAKIKETYDWKFVNEHNIIKEQSDLCKKNDWVIAKKNEKVYYGNIKSGEMLTDTLEDAVKYETECDAAFGLEDAIDLEILDDGWEVRKV